ncbi:MAG: hypothetical protein ACYC9J_15265 [Sulfuricaulis sp.]
MKRKIVLIVILILSHFVFYVLGAIVNRHNMLSAFTREYTNAQSGDDLGSYINYRYIALAIKARQYENALCNAELNASNRYDDLKACMADEACKTAIEEEVQKLAPEVLGKAPLQFTYIPRKDGIRKFTYVQSKDALKPCGKHP